MMNHRRKVNVETMVNRLGIIKTAIEVDTAVNVKRLPPGRFVFVHIDPRLSPFWEFRAIARNPTLEKPVD